MNRSKINRILIELNDGDTRLTEREFVDKDGKRTGHKFLAVERFSSYMDKKVKNIKRIADEIALEKKLLNSTSIENYLFSETGTMTSADNGTIHIGI